MTVFLDSIDEQLLAHPRPIGGRIYLQIGDQFFPDENWYDYASILLENWIPLITSFLHGSTQNCKLAFMDGPCHVLLRRLSDCFVVVDCFYNQKKVLSDTVIDPIRFADSFVKTGNRYTRWLHLQGREDAAFAASLQKLKQELRTVREAGSYNVVT